MAIVYAIKTGNASDPSLWNTGSLPAISDDIYANGFNVDLDYDITVNTIRTTQRSGGTNGGSFTINTNNRNITATSGFHIGGGTISSTLTNNTIILNGNFVATSLTTVTSLSLTGNIDFTLNGNLDCTLGRIGLVYRGLDINTGSITINGYVYASSYLGHYNYGLDIQNCNSVYIGGNLFATVTAGYYNHALVGSNINSIHVVGDVKSSGYGYGVNTSGTINKIIVDGSVLMSTPTSYAGLYNTSITYTDITIKGPYCKGLTSLSQTGTCEIYGDVLYTDITAENIIIHGNIITNEGWGLKIRGSGSKFSYNGNSLYPTYGTSLYLDTNREVEVTCTEIAGNQTNQYQYGIDVINVSNLIVNANILGSKYNSICRTINNISSCNITINGNVYTDPTRTVYCIYSTNGNLTINGNINDTALIKYNAIAYGNSTGTVTINGNVYGSTNTTNNHGISLDCYNLYVTGNLYGGTNESIYNNKAISGIVRNEVIITGDCIGGAYHDNNLNDSEALFVSINPRIFTLNGNCLMTSASGSIRLNGSESTDIVITGTIIEGFLYHGNGGSFDTPNTTEYKYITLGITGYDFTGYRFHLKTEYRSPWAIRLVNATDTFIFDQDFEPEQSGSNMLLIDGGSGSIILNGDISALKTANDITHTVTIVNKSNIELIVNGEVRGCLHAYVNSRYSNAIYGENGTLILNLNVYGSSVFNNYHTTIRWQNSPTIICYGDLIDNLCLMNTVNAYTSPNITIYGKLRNIYSTYVIYLQYFQGTCTLVGEQRANRCNGTAINMSYYSSTGVLNIIGDIIGHSVSDSIQPVDSYIYSEGILNITGDIIVDKNINTATTPLIRLASSSICNVTGNIYGGNYMYANAIRSNVNGSIVTVTGNVYGGTSPLSYAISCSSITTDAIAQRTTTVWMNIDVVGVIESGTGCSAIFNANENATNTFKGNFISKNGYIPYICSKVFISDSESQSILMQTVTNTDRYLSTSNSTAGYPLEIDVRKGIQYGSVNEYEGTCAVPNPDNVQKGVLVDNTTGTTMLTTADFQNAISNVVGNTMSGLLNNN